MGTNDLKVNLSRLTFPSDRLTLGKIREAIPEPFDSDNISLPDYDFFPLTGMLDLERQLANKVFCSTAGLPDPDPRDSEASLVQPLVQGYVLFGIAEGVQHARQLVREIKDAAIAQAKEQLGKHR